MCIGIAFHLRQKLQIDLKLSYSICRQILIRNWFCYPGNVWNFGDGDAQIVEQGVRGAAEVIVLHPTAHKLELAVDADRLHACNVQ